MFHEVERRSVLGWDRHIHDPLDRMRQRKGPAGEGQEVGHGKVIATRVVESAGLVPKSIVFDLGKLWHDTHHAQTWCL